MKLYQRVRSAVYGAYMAWKGVSYDFSPWRGKIFLGIENSTLATNETIFSIITRLSNIMATLPLKLYKSFDVIDTDTSDTLINSPNVNATGFDFIRQLEVSRNESGNGYALIQRNIRMQVENLWILQSNYVVPVLDTDTRELWYEVMGASNQRYLVHNMDMIHVKHISGSGSLKGISPIDVLKNANDFDKAVREFSLKEMQGAQNSFILKYGANIDEKKRQAVIDDFKRFYQDNGGILFQEPGVEINALDRKYVAADTFTSERITRSRVANVFNVPTTMLNDTEGQSYSSNEQLMRMFVDLTLMPIVRQYEQEFNRKLLTPTERKSGRYFKFNVNSLLRGDTAARTSFYNMMLRSGGMKPDEVRRLEDLPPEGGNADKLWVSGDLYPIDMDPSQRKATATPTPSKGGEENEQGQEE
ncbi:phage portal protein [Terribacillus saccharophilus]|uniref:phage portal protein n=1 Tax=Terribacillus saccharophilus TaxID=361277 RepID=UPI002DC626A7|nr:phage portal protein [Terribacillus saccharophilus]MEC0288815.1 phage portal protein [Terribacillus saccharophilus]